jgi:hypothetical protein
MISPLLLEMLVQSRLQELAIADERRHIAEDPLHLLSAPAGSLSPPLLTWARSIELLRRSLTATRCRWWIRGQRFDRLWLLGESNS